jgi:excisionase family DNA binding protein
MSTLVQQQLLTVRETAERLAISEKSVRRRIRAGVIPALRLGQKGSAIRIPADELAGWIDERRTAGASSPPSPAETLPRALGPRRCRAVEPGRVARGPSDEPL